MAWPIMGSASLFMMALGGVFVMNGMRAGLDQHRRRLHAAALHDGALVRRRDPRIGGRQVQPLGGRVVPLGDELLHLLRGDVLRRVLRRAVLGARVLGAGSRRRIESNALVWPGFTAHWPSAGPNFIEKFTPDGRVGPARAQHRAAAHLRRDGHLRALEPARQQPRQADPLARRDGRARRRVPDLPGDRVRARLRASSTSRCTPGSTARPSSCSPASTASTSPSARSC